MLWRVPINMALSSLKFIGVSEEIIASFFKAEDYTNQETSSKYVSVGL
jgi:hypothetical protein